MTSRGPAGSNRSGSWRPCSSSSACSCWSRTPCASTGSGCDRRAPALHDLRRRRARRHAPADAAHVRAEGPRPAEAHGREHAPLLGGRPRAPAPDPEADGRARAQPRRRRGRARARGAAAADAGADGTARARDARGDRERAQAVPPRPRDLRPNSTTGAKVDFNKLTLKSQEAVAAAQELARRMGNPELYPEHLTLALLDQELPQQLVPDPAELRAQAEAALRTKPSTQGAQQQPQVSAAVSRVLDKAFDEAKRMEDEYVSTEHLLLALDVVPREQLEAKIAVVRGGQRVTSQDPEGTY